MKFPFFRFYVFQFTSFFVLGVVLLGCSNRDIPLNDGAPAQKQVDRGIEFPKIGLDTRRRDRPPLHSPTEVEAIKDNMRQNL